MSEKNNYKRTLKASKIVNLKRKKQQSSLGLKGKKITTTIVEYKKELSELEDNLFEDWTWRAKELSELILLSEGNENNKVLCKTFYLLLYSHWEGYIKNSSYLYLEYISKTSYKIVDLTDNFSALFIKGLMKELEMTKDSLTVNKELELIKSLTNLNELKIGKKLKINVNNDKDKSIINTQDNLSSKVFKNICEVVGTSYKEVYDLRKRIIDHDLLNTRNAISHGNVFLEEHDSFFDLKNIKKLRDYILAIIEVYRDELISFAKEHYFLKCNTDDRILYTNKLNNELSISFEKIDKKYSN